MAKGRQVELPLVSKSPFANYDIVVYLGGGFFTLLVLWRYVASPFGIFDFSGLAQSGNQPWPFQVILITLFAVMSYIIGHLVSYLSAYFIEGGLNRTLGKFSDIAKLALRPFPRFCEELRKEIRSNRIKNFSRTAIKIPFVKWKPKVRKENFLIWAFHLPMGWWYWFITWRGYFRFADTRLPSRMFAHLDTKLQIFFGIDTKRGRQWFRWVEYYTSYNAPVASASMYNYLVISGLMRSLSFIFLMSIWFEIMHLGFFLAKTGLPNLSVKEISHGPGGLVGHALYAFVLIIGYICTSTSYFKFFRRYVEEAVMGFLLEVPPRPTAN